jgi:hypothetical protein
MDKKRLFSGFASLILALVVLAGSFQSASAAFITDNAYVIGNQGFFVPAGFDSDLMFLERASMDGSPVTFAQTPVRIVLEGEGSMPFTYIFFELDPWEQRAYTNEDLHIYFRDNATGFWSTCNAFVVNDHEDNFRIACVASQPTTYGIGTTDPDAIPSIFP